MSKQTMTARVEFVFQINEKQLRNAITSLLSEKTKSSVPRRKETFPDIDPGSALKEARIRKGLSQKEVAEQVGVSQVYISQMETQKRVIGEEIARQLGKALNVDHRIFLL